MGNSVTPQNYKKSLFHHDRKPLVEVKESEDDDLASTLKLGLNELQKEKDSEVNHDSMKVNNGQ